MFFIDVKLALVSLSVLPFLIYGTFLFRRKVREMYREIRRLIASLNSFMNEHFSGMNTVQIFNRQKKSFGEFDKINEDHKDAQKKSIFYYALYYPSVDFLTATVVALIIWYGGSADNFRIYDYWNSYLFYSIYGNVLPTCKGSC